MTVPEDDVKVVREHGEPEDINGEATGQKPDPLFNPSPAVLVVDACDRIRATQKASPHAAVNGVEDGHFVDTTSRIKVRSREWPWKTPRAFGFVGGR